MIWPLQRLCENRDTRKQALQVGALLPSALNMLSLFQTKHQFSAGFNLAMLKLFELNFVLLVGCLILNYLYKYRDKIYNFSQNVLSASKNIVRGNTLVSLPFVTEKSDDLFFEELSKLYVFGMRT